MSSPKNRPSGIVILAVLWFIGAIDTYIVIGTISGKSWTSVDGSPTYGGGSLTSYTITPEWTT